jgi:hypothetical protein
VLGHECEADQMRKFLRGRYAVSEKQLFGVLVRTIGVLVFLEGVRAFLVDLLLWNWPGGFGNNPRLFGPLEWAYGPLVMLVGALITRWPGWVVYLAWLEKLPTIGQMPGDES